MAMINYADKVALNSNSNIADINKVNATDMNELKNAFNNQVAQGWYKTGINPTFTFVSWDSTTYTGVVSSNLDMTPYLNVGMKVKFTQNASIKYGIIVAITSTRITLFMGTDYTLLNAVITNAFYSMEKAPYGFPMNEAKWSIIVTDTTDRSQVTSGATVYNLGGINITIPIGLWKVKYKGLFQIGNAVATSNAKYMTISLSTANNTINADNAIGIAGADIKFNRLYSEKTIDNLLLTSNTPYYLNVRDDAGGGNTVYFLNSNVGGLTLIIQALCAYL